MITTKEFDDAVTKALDRVLSLTPEQLSERREFRDGRDRARELSRRVLQERINEALQRAGIKEEVRVVRDWDQQGGP